MLATKGFHICKALQKKCILHFLSLIIMPVYVTCTMRMYTDGIHRVYTEVQSMEHRLPSDFDKHTVTEPATKNTEIKLWTIIDNVCFNLPGGWTIFTVK